MQTLSKYFLYQKQICSSNRMATSAINDKSDEW